MRGGAETFLMKIYRVIDKEKYQMDFIVSTKEEGFYDNEIKRLGGRIYYVPAKSENFIKSFLAIKSIVKEKKYKYVIRVNEHSLSVLDLIAAKLGGADKLIMRSSNAGTAGKKLNKVLHKMFKFLPKIVPNVKLAPSSEAACYTFGKKQLKNGKVKILHNAIPYRDFIFNCEIREKVRKNLKIEDIQDKMRVNEATGKKAYESYSSGTGTVYKTGTYPYSSNKWYPLQWKQDNGIEANLKIQKAQILYPMHLKIMPRLKKHQET